MLRGAQLLRQSEQALRIELLIFKYPGSGRQEDVYPPGIVLARRCQHRSLDRPGEGPVLSPVVALPGEPCGVMGPRGRECCAVSPKSLSEDCDGTYGEKFLHTSLHFLESSLILHFLSNTHILFPVMVHSLN